MNSKDIPKISSIAFGVLTLSFVIGFYAFAAWEEPSALPPGGNVSVPINIGSAGQQKLFENYVSSNPCSSKAGQLGIALPLGDNYDCTYALSVGNNTTRGNGLKGIKISGDSFFENNLSIGTFGSPADLYVSGNVGIGISPTSTYALNVNGGINLNNNYISNVATSSDPNSVATKEYVDSQLVGAASPWTSTSTGIYYNDGNVGIGTTTPRTGLDVNGDVWATNFSGNGSGLTSAGQWTRGASYIYGKNSTQVRVFDNGNVAIGRNTPYYKLEVNGWIKSDSGGFIFPDGSTLTSAPSAGGSKIGGSFTKNVTGLRGTGASTQHIGTPFEPSLILIDAMGEFAYSCSGHEFSYGVWSPSGSSEVNSSDGSCGYDYGANSGRVIFLVTRSYGYLYIAGRIANVGPTGFDIIFDTDPTWGATDQKSFVVRWSAYK